MAEKKFDSMDELVRDKLFLSFVEQNLNELRSQRLHRKDPKPGFHYKRDVFDRLFESGRFNSVYFSLNYVDIWCKKSSLSSAERSVIKYVCDKSLNQMFAEYEKLEKQESETQKVEP